VTNQPHMDRPDLSQREDTDLVDAVSSGDEAALSELYRRYGSLVTGLARRILGDSQLAEDITQEVFVHLWRNADRFDGQRGKLRTLLLTQTHGKCVDLVRSRNARAARESKSFGGAMIDSAELDAELMAITETEQIRAAVQQLPSEERIALETAYFGGNTYRQVAVVLGLPEGTVKARIRSALKRLHLMLTQPDIEARAGEMPATQLATKKDSPWPAS
jgi:RNA polymerase sigma-70 factor, ECF subfamily